MVSLSADGTRLVYSTNIGDIDRRRVMSVAADGKSVEQLVFPDEVRGFLRHDSGMRAYEAALDFFARRM